ALSDGACPTEGLMAELEADLKAAVGEIAIREGKGRGAPATEARAFDKVSALALIDRIEPLLASGDASALGFVGEIRETLGSCGEKCADLIGRIEDFDFYRAHEILDELKNLVGELA
ncbi:MAG: hypothetical protein LBQ36_07045, partial [Synergistaceae bacterium]|nr:hypothetical protein [Synergistaceae bacterium]